ncbi:g11737 [Coccomyxa viridis]|uniref:G11737 protein n=1 Tax=Coccomyxa viridis TaxID=1274662 RepID=A0ABP1GDC4_9CHLO
MVPGDGHPSPDVDSNQIYHETAAQMREAHQDEMERTPRSGTPDLVHAVPGREDDLQGTATYPSSEEALDQDRPVSAAAAVHAAMEENSVLPSADRTPSAVAGPAASDAKVTEHGTSPRRSVTIQDTAEVIGEASPDEEAPQSPSAATDSTSDSSGVADLSGSGAHSYLHYRIGKDVILRLEFISPEDTRAALIFLWVVELTGLALLLEEFGLKLHDNDGAFRNRSWTIVNVVFGSICFVLLSCALLTYAVRSYKAHSLGKRWKKRRRRFAMLALVELIAQWVNSAFFVIPNAVLLARPCGFFSELVAACAIVRWTMLNTIFLCVLVEAHMAYPCWRTERDPENGRQSFTDWRTVLSANTAIWASGQPRERRSPKVAMPGHYEGAIIDAPWIVHLPKVIIWIIFEGLLVAAAVNYITGHGVSQIAKAERPRSCFPRHAGHACETTNAQLALTVLLMVTAYIYFALYFYHLIGALLELRTLPHQDHQITSLQVRLQLKVRTLVVIFYTLSIALLWFVKPRGCRSFVYTWYGMLPLQVVTTGAALTWSFFALPNRHYDDKTPLLQEWLQEFAWTEEERDVKFRRRAADGEVGELLSKEPMFCFETAMNMLYWTALAYDYAERDPSELSLETAMGVYDLKESELFWEKALDTKLLIAWNDHMMVLAFRGTASVSNALADLQAWRVTHPPRRGRCWRRPLVHSGFLKSWTRNAFNTRVIERVLQIIREAPSGKTPDNPFRVIVTGHSLGGALAQLAAHEISTAAAAEGLYIRVVCYTFGAPRVGNHAFAREYTKLVPHTWNMINHQDAVARAPKFLGLYKRAGQRVHINHYGDMMVRPSAIQVSLIKAPCGGSVPNHLLGDYLQSLLAVLLAQFSRKGFPGGMQGVVRLAEKSEPIQGLLLDGIGLTVENMRRLARWHGRLIDPALARTSAYDAAAQRLARRKAAQHEAKQQARPAADGDAQVVEHGQAGGAAQRLEEVSREHRTSLLSRMWRNVRAHIAADQPTRKGWSENCGSRSMAHDRQRTVPDRHGSATLGRESMFDSGDESASDAMVHAPAA